MILYKANIRIYLDSKVVIEGIQNFKSLISIRNNFKTKNYSLISQIVDCYKSKKNNLKLIKVKGYSINL